MFKTGQQYSNVTDECTARITIIIMSIVPLGT
jgi:hypothetical protein